jgi:hypothetical protein
MAKRKSTKGQEEFEFLHSGLSVIILLVVPFFLFHCIACPLLIYRLSLTISYFQTFLNFVDLYYLIIYKEKVQKDKKSLKIPKG